MHGLHPPTKSNKSTEIQTGKSPICRLTKSRASSGWFEQRPQKQKICYFLWLGLIFAASRNGPDSHATVLVNLSRFFSKCNFCKFVEVALGFGSRFPLRMAHSDDSPVCLHTELTHPFFVQQSHDLIHFFFEFSFCDFFARPP